MTHLYHQFISKTSQTIPISFHTISKNSIQFNQYLGPERIINNRMKGNKLNITQHRQKKQLKIQNITRFNRSRNYLNTNIQQSEQYENPQPQDINHSDLSEFVKRSIRPRTGNFTADAGLANRRRKLFQGLQTEGNRSNTIMVNSMTAKPKSKILQPFFLSPNLNHRANDEMNLMIRKDSKTQGPNDVHYIEQIHHQGVIPHMSKLNTFQRKLKMKKKTKSLSKQKVKINLEMDVINSKNISATLQAIASHSKSPLISSLQHKTTFGKSKKNHFRHFE